MKKILLFQEKLINWFMRLGSSSSKPGNYKAVKLKRGPYKN